MWITLAETVRLTSNDRTSTFKLHARPVNETEERFVSPIKTFERLIRKNIEDIKLQAQSLTDRGYLSKGRYTGEVHLLLQNSSQVIFQPETNGVRQKYDLLVSSSPYGDNQTTVPYGQHAFLALQWIDLADIDYSVDGSVRRTANEIDRRSLGGSLQDAKQEELTALFVKTPTLSRIVAALKVQHSDKVKKVVAFVRDFDRALDKAVAAMASNGYFIWTMGNRHVGGMEIENDKILVELMQTKGCVLVTRAKREILNKRMAQRNDTSRTMSMEDILIFRKTTE